MTLKVLAITLHTYEYLFVRIYVYICILYIFICVCIYINVHKSDVISNVCTYNFLRAVFYPGGLLR